MSEIGYEFDSDILTEDRIDVKEPNNAPTIAPSNAATTSTS